VSGLNDVRELLALPFVAALLLTGIHAYFGIHVLRRNVVFVDLALAQIAGLGATVAFMLGHPPQSPAAYGYSLAFTLIGAAVLAASRHWSGRVPQEALIGVVYVVAAAAVLLLVDQAPQGAEHIKRLLVGNILTVTAADVARLAALYGAVAAFHWIFRRRLLLVSFDPAQARAQGLRFWLWDFLFYASFGVVVTSSVAVGGVLLVFAFLIIPAAVGLLYAERLAATLLIAWLGGALASAAGLGVSYAADLPTGATLVCAFGALLVVAAALRHTVFGGAERRRAIWRRLRAATKIAMPAALLLAALWLILLPRADHPLLDAFEAWQPGIRAVFLTPQERAQWSDARHDARRYRAEVERLRTLERDSRWQGEAASDDELRRLGSYTQTFLEMQRGEQFVERALRNKARERQRWILGVPALLLAVAALLGVAPGLQRRWVVSADADTGRTVRI